MALELVSRSMPPRVPFPPTTTPPDPRVATLLDAESITSLILDAEIVAVDKETGTKRTFQELTNRAKKDVKVGDIKVVVQVCAFDLMLLNDTVSCRVTSQLSSRQPLLSASFAHRRHLLRTLLPPLPVSDPRIARFAHVDSVDSVDLQTPAQLRAFFDTVVARKAEGMMVKLLEGERGAADEAEAEVETEDEEEAEEADEDTNDKGKANTRKKPLPATYEPDQRSMGWLKVKKGKER
jgi:DNA ligase-1